MSELKSREEVLAEHLQDPEYRAEWERTALARAVALEVTRYRAAHNLSQRALAVRLAMKQPAIARLESGDVNPTIDTLLRLSRELGLTFHVDITPQGLDLSA